MAIDEVSSIVLAGGKGERMKSDLPKVLQSLQGKPLIHHVLDSLSVAGVTDIVTVVGYRGDTVIDAISDRSRHVWQHEQLGTGHAVMQAEEALAGFRGAVLVACGDVPLIRSETVKRMLEKAQDEKVKAVVLTMEVPDPTGYGRILKNDAGDFQRIVEEKDATDSERTIKEVNTGTYVFDKDCLFQGLKQVDCNNAQGEYYLPDALTHILDSGYRVETLLLDDPVEGTGVNTREELKALEEYVASRLDS